MTTTVDNFFVPSLSLVQPGARQSTAYLNSVLAAIAAGFEKIAEVTAVTTGASTTIAATDPRTVLIAGNSLTHTVSLPAAPTAGDPPIKILNCGTGNVITISGNGKPIMSGSTAGEITLRSPGDHIELVYVNATFGWAILSIKSNRQITVSGSGSVQLNRFQDTFVYMDDGGSPWSYALHLPSDAQIGDSMKIHVYFVSGSSDLLLGDGVEVVQGSTSQFNISTRFASQGISTVVCWFTASGWVVQEYA